MAIQQKTSSPWALVLAGGSGRRLEPLTLALFGKPVPKQYCRIGRKDSLLQDTVARLSPTTPCKKTVVIADSSQVDLARSQVRKSGVTVLGQPMDRGTAPGVLFPLMHILLQDPEATVVVTPSDHAIADKECFCLGIEEAIHAVESDPGQIVLFGVEANAPRTDYGWIVPKNHVKAFPGYPLRRVARFTEKPPFHEARVLHRMGALWNTFVMVAKGKTMAQLYRDRLPEIARFFDRYAALDERRRSTWLFANYDRLPTANFSEDILTGAPNLSVYTWPASLAWTDLGTPGRLFEWLDDQGELDPVMEKLRLRGATDLIQESPRAAAV